MGPSYPVLSATQVVKSLERLGFIKITQKGSHLKLKKQNNDTKIVIVPLHKEIAKGTLKSILEQAGISLDELINHI